MWVELLPYQVEALEKLRDGCILNGNVGSGKSLVSLMYYYISQGGVYDPSTRKTLEHPIDLYIITTPKKRDTLEWEKELCTFGLTTSPDGTAYGNHVVVDSWNNIKKYTAVTDAFFIFDEQRVVGSGAWANHFIEITKKNPHWLLLSATPGDTWLDYIPVFIANGFYRNRSDFMRQHVVYKSFRKFPQVDRYIDTGRLIRLRERILVLMIRPEERAISEEFCIFPYDQKLYKTIMKERFDPWNQTPIQNASGLAYCLRKAVNIHPSRGQEVLKILELRRKIIVFYSFNYEREILLNLSYPEDVEVAEWSGCAHQEIPDADSWVYLVQYTAGCEGWNCIKTNTVVFYSQQYSYKVLEQAKGRINRLNAPFRTLYYYIFKSNSKIDLAIAKAISNKKKFNAGAYFRRCFSDVEEGKMRENEEENVHFFEKYAKIPISTNFV